MTPHADRDHSEPYWPPAATREPRDRCTCAVKCNTAHVCAEMPQAVWLDDSEIKAVVARYLDSHPEEKAELDRLAQGDLVRRFPLEDGDTGAPLLPAAPAGTLLHCPVCPAALADTRGGRLDHCDDGSHHYVPEPQAGRQADLLGSFVDQSKRLAKAERALADERVGRIGDDSIRSMELKDALKRAEAAEAKVAQAWDDGYAMASDDFTHSDYCGTTCQCEGIHGQGNPYRAALPDPTPQAAP